MENLPDFGSPLGIGGMLLALLLLVLVVRRRVRAGSARSEPPEPTPAATEAAFLDSSHIGGENQTGSLAE